MSEEGYSEPTLFACARCGNCCSGEGFVRIGSEEVEPIANFLHMTPVDFLQTFCRLPEIGREADRGDWWLIDGQEPGNPCVFLDKGGCAIQPVKPAQCIGFPRSWRTPDVLEYCAGLKM